MWRQIHGPQREQLRSKASKLTVVHALFTQTHGVFTHFSRFFTHISTTCGYHDVWSTDITARIQCPTKVESAGLTGTLPKFRLNLHVEDQGNLTSCLVHIGNKNTHLTHTHTHTHVSWLFSLQKKTTNPNATWWFRWHLIHRYIMTTIKGEDLATQRFGHLFWEAAWRAGLGTSPRGPGGRLEKSPYRSLTWLVGWMKPTNPSGKNMHKFVKLDHGKTKDPGWTFQTYLSETSTESKTHINFATRKKWVVETQLLFLLGKPIFKRELFGSFREGKWLGSIES